MDFTLSVTDLPLCAANTAAFMPMQITGCPQSAAAAMEKKGSFDSKA